MKTDSQSSTPTRVYLKDYVAPAYAIDSVHLYFNLFETKTIVKAKMVFSKKRDEPLVLDGEGIKLLKVKVDGKELSSREYMVTESHLTFDYVPYNFTLETEVEINPEANKACAGLYLSHGIFCTQCEAESFRNITYFLDRPDVMTSYTVEIEADKKKYPILLSNGDCIETKDLEGGRHWALWKDPFKKPSYLFALVAGDMGVVRDTFKTRSGKNVKLEVYAPHGKQDRCHHAMESLKKSMKWDEDRFGLEYDLNQYMIVSIDDFNMGAMENKGLNVFNSRLVLADAKTATDTDFETIESVVGHEYFHNWTGNRVTCRNWFELSLKEGLTVYRDQEFSSDMNSRAVQRIKDVDSLRTRQFTEDDGPNAHPVRPESCLAVDNFYTATIYEKGAEVIRMMETIVGREGFRKGMDEYFKRHDGQAVTIDDFAAAISEPNKQDFTQFKLWYSQAGTPVIEVHEGYDVSKKVYTLKLIQSCPDTPGQTDKQPFHIPLKFGLIDHEGKEIKLPKNILHLKEKKQNWTFENLAYKPVLSLNREFSAPVKIKWKASNQELLHLIKYDTDAFNRREACMKMLLDETRRLIAQFKKSEPLMPEKNIVDALGIVLADQKIDPQFKSLILSLPSDTILAQEEEVLDAAAFFAAKDAIAKAFVAQFEKQMIETYKKHHGLSTMGDRALKNRLLDYLVSTGSAKGIELCIQQYNTAANMTDSISALASLCETNSDEKETALKDFYSKWNSDSVVFNKWLQVQAGSSSQNTFDRVKKCMEVQAFDAKNPNNLYSLHRTFGENYLRFHVADGLTYKWYADEIIRIDAANPQVAARLAMAFNFTKKLPTQTKEKAQTEISRVLANQGLSKNTREMLEKCV